MDAAVIVRLDDQIIYQATKDIFVGQKAKYRKRPPVKKSIGSHLRKGSLIRQLATQYGADAIHQPVLNLLSDRVYESTSIASERFPDLFEPSTAQTATRSLLEAEATRSEQAALEGIVQTQWANSQGTLDWTGITTALYGLERFLADAEELVRVLGDTVYAKAISHLRSDAQSTLMELTRNKQFIQLQLERAQGEIAKQRAKLN
ncbi:uncharacterized protein FTOL_10284 [Fusarium torulosum]|uniref:Uncharacterized protein n=1 Tax=Fusarium torulosum TaxID=33205 RepID=A0AAE8SMD0_9HYPO|nr:uncharacterized protein FTOL_10284 [Fusarium torulosum]